MTMTATEFVEGIQRFCNVVVEGIRQFLQPLIDWFNSPQVRNFFKCLASAARRAGIVQASKVPVRRRTVSTKRALIYQRKMQGLQCRDR